MIDFTQPPPIASFGQDQARWDRAGEWGGPRPGSLESRVLKKFSLSCLLRAYLLFLQGLPRILDGFVPRFIEQLTGTYGTVMYPHLAPSLLSFEGSKMTDGGS